MTSINRPLNFNALDYYNNRRLSVIMKSKKSLQMRLQAINNQIIDNFIMSYHLENIDEINPTIYFNQIQMLNRKDTSRHFAGLLDNSALPKNSMNKIDANLKYMKVANTISAAEIERVQKNILWANKIVQQADLDINVYKKLTEKLSPTSSRKLMIEKSIQEGKNITTGYEYSYKELKNVSRNLERYKTHSLDLEAKRMENRQAIVEGLNPIYQTKTWVWSQKENTRHEGMDNETVPLDSKFEVVNELTGETDYLLYPGDIENMVNVSNVANCACTYIINRS